MKSFFTLCFFTCLSAFNNTSGQTLYAPGGSAGIEDSNNSNVGVADPLEKIHMVGNLKLDGHAGVIFNTPNATSDPYNFIAFSREDEKKWLIDHGTVQTNNLRFLRFSCDQFKTFLNLDYDNFEFEILNTKVGIGTSSSAFQIHMKGPIGGSALGMGRNGKLWRFDLDFTEAGKLYISHTNKSNVLVLSRYGNIGVGTANPDAKLTVAGKIHSREVKVTVNAGADHVFKDDYPLTGLEKLEDFINENHHLPEIAPAKEMVENGLEVGEFQIKLLQKIEELTLYIINQQKEIKALKEKVSGMENSQR
ncbi:MAG: hypothetical protein MI921_29375 [Cytophagales bacterium]|nr:hypothetical protein [Cytophagales bacterium]